MWSRQNMAAKSQGLYSPRIAPFSQASIGVQFR